MTIIPLLTSVYRYYSLADICKPVNAPLPASLWYQYIPNDTCVVLVHIPNVCMVICSLVDLCVVLGTTLSTFVWN